MTKNRISFLYQTMNSKVFKLSHFLKLTAVFFILLCQTALAQENEDISRFFNKAIIQVLNKTNAKSEIFEIDVNKKTTINSLKLTIHKCWQAPLQQRPESKMLIEISEADSSQKNSKEKRIFYGWIFASSPSISSLEHPIYDIVAINCKK